MKKEHDDYPHKLEEIYEELTGNDWESAEDDASGCYFSPGNWVSGSAIADAFKELADFYDDYDN